MTDILGAIGNTPLVRLQRLPRAHSAQVLAKLESLNPSGSIKDRVALAIIEAAERGGQLRPGGTILQATGGNTGISLAFVAAAKGYRVVITMPEGSNPVRANLLERYGAEVRTQPAAQGMAGALDLARDLLEQNPDWFLPDQFDNAAVVEVHRRTTALEILAQTDGDLQAFVAGVGTGGTITGVGSVLKERLPSVAIVAVEPAESPLLSAGWSGPHQIAGISANFIPPNLDRRLIDRVVTVTDADAYKVMGQLSREEGLMVGPSSGACVYAALRVAEELGEGSRVVTVLADSGDRYLNVSL